MEKEIDDKDLLIIVLCSYLNNLGCESLVTATLKAAEEGKLQQLLSKEA